MSVTVSVRANTRALTTRERVKRLLEIDDTSRDQLMDELILAASAAVETFCHRIFAREAVVETVRGFGGTVLMLTRTPLVLLTSVIANGQDPITDAVRESDEAGMLYRKVGWLDTTQLGWGLSATLIPNTADPLYTVTYSAGYLLPGDDVESDGGLSVDGPSRTFLLGDGSFPLTLVGGDRVYVQGFTLAANNGWFTVAANGVAAGALTVAETTLQTEPVDEGLRTVAVSTLPADVELSARETVRSMYTSRTRDSEVQSKSVGDLSVTYRDRGTTTEGLPVECLKRLGPWVRVA